MGQGNFSERECGLVKRCNCCLTEWRSREEFIDDPCIELIGYQVNFDDLQLGFLLFNHRACGSTLALPVAIFRDMYEGPVYQARATGGPECPGYCIKEKCLDSCGARCECAYVREIISVVLSHHR